MIYTRLSCYGPSKKLGESIVLLVERQQQEVGRCIISNMNVINICSNIDILCDKTLKSKQNLYILHLPPFIL